MGILKRLGIFVCAFIISICTISLFNRGKDDISIPTRDLELVEQDIKISSDFNAFDSYNLEISDCKADFVGYDTMKLSDLYELDLVSDSKIDGEVLIKYSCFYDYENGIVTLNVKMVDGEKATILDTVYGAVIMDEELNFDVAFDCEGETLLLSELEEAGVLDNCGFWSKLKKVWNTTAGKIGTIATVATCAVVGVVCAVVPGGQLVTAACIGVAVGALGGALTAGIATYIEEGVVDWKAVLCYAGAGAVVGCVTATASYKITSAIKQLFPKANPTSQVKGFESQKAFAKEYGKASNYVSNGEWHHIVEQQTVTKVINSPVSVYNSQNTVAIPKELHVKITGYYNSMNTNLGMTNRAYINSLPYEQQYAKGIEILKMFADKMGIIPYWL